MTALWVSWLLLIASALLSGLLLFNLSGHQDVVRDLSFTPSGSLILVSASRDKTLRIWDLNKHGRDVVGLLGYPKSNVFAGFSNSSVSFLSRMVFSQSFCWYYFLRNLFRCFHSNHPPCPKETLIPKIYHAVVLLYLRAVSSRTPVDFDVHSLK